ncbi:methyltransferase domain-containing protein [Ferruginibacter sp.]|jgi:SAM-dependent methyltransferase|uniref:class I SAM-dependent methyltransferase n=1 Tax=Ferruginibacter sp. TaxID=1940288 RepID=UPI0019C2B245|nr:methyltransferase domain-containing protein [Ferruginibacter sp.]MBC7627784.1 class I SAM-dependent methyltransferase [Ferruginibacter sp.]
MLDKKNILPQIAAYKTVILDIGCGPLKKQPHWIGIDMLDADGVDITGDIYEVIKAFPDGCVDEVHATHFLEHLPDVPGLLIELNRILKQNGFIEIVVPHFSNAYFYSDYTHQKFFGLYSFSYMVKDNLLKRKVPSYNLHTGLQLKAVFLHFKSPWIINRPFRKLCQVIFNASTFMKEWYEDSWSSNISCYEVEFILIKL